MNYAKISVRDSQKINYTNNYFLTFKMSVRASAFLIEIYFYQFFKRINFINLTF